MPAVRTIEEIRHARLLELLADKARFPTVQALADAIDRSHAQVSQWKNKSERRNKDGEVVGYSNIDSASARHIEQKVGKPVGWMDNDPEWVPRSTIAEAAREPPAPDFRSRGETESDWALLDAIKWLPDERKEELRQEAARFEAHYRRIHERITAGGGEEVSQAPPSPASPPGRERLLNPSAKKTPASKKRFER